MDMKLSFLGSWQHRCHLHSIRTDVSDDFWALAVVEVSLAVDILSAFLVYYIKLHNALADVSENKSHLG